jgi:hypothetical protein
MFSPCHLIDRPLTSVRRKNKDGWFVYLHGGAVLSGRSRHDDLYQLSLQSFEWTLLKPHEGVVAARAEHRSLSRAVDDLIPITPTESSSSLSKHRSVSERERESVGA